MSRRRRRTLTKAAPRVPVRPAATFTADQVTALVQAGLTTTGPATPLPRAPQTMFGPGIPVFPAAIDPPREDTGRPEPRIYEYPVSINLPGMTDRLVPWKVLRDAAEIPVVRDCIRIRKNEVATLDWDIVVSKRALQRYRESDPDTSSVTIKRELRAKLGPEVARLTEFWSLPDWQQGETFPEWAGKALEEHLVLDALSIYPFTNRGGNRVGLRVLDGSCYSADTEVLTESGWKTFDDVILATDRFATRNQKTHAFEWQSASYFHEADWDSTRDGDCYAVKSRSLDLLVTPNHRMLVDSLPMKLGGNSHRKGEVFVTAADLHRYGTLAQAIPATSLWDAPSLREFVLTGNGRTTSMGITFTGDDFAAFMGMYLAEGCYTNGDQVVISQRPSSKGYEPFRQLLERVFARKMCHTGLAFVIGRRVLHDYLQQFGKAHQKHVPTIIKGMSRDQLQIFWDYYVLGDGHIDKGGRQGVVTSSPRMAGDLQEIAQKLGYSASVSTHHATGDTVMPDGRVIRKENQRPSYMIRLRTSQRQHFTMTPVPYRGKVYCVSVPNEVLYVRRHGKPAWCGNTVKPLLDGNGGRPMPPHPSYQQILWGFPRGEFVADVTDDGHIINGYPSDRLIYRRREVRTHSPYGLSAVEQALQDVDLYLRRLEWMKTQYTDGVTPAGWLKNAGLEHWTPQQLADYNRAFNDLYAGNTLERMRHWLLPPGIEPIPGGNDTGERYKPEYDLHLIKLVAMHFDVTIAELGFTEAKGLGSAGYHEGQARVQARTGKNPTLSWLQTVLTDISRTHLGMPPELEFRFIGLDADEANDVDQALERQVRSGRITWNEAREETGRAPYSFPEADMPVVVSNGGELTFLEGSSVAPSPAAAGLRTTDVTGRARESEEPPEIASSSEQSLRKAELAAYGKWLRNGHTPGRRPFQFRHVTQSDATAHGIDLDRVTFMGSSP